MSAYDRAATQLGLRPLDPRLRTLAEAAARLASTAALAMAPQLPMLVDSLAPVVGDWRARGPMLTLP